MANCIQDAGRQAVARESASAPAIRLAYLLICSPVFSVSFICAPESICLSEDADFAATERRVVETDDMKVKISSLRDS